jgi:hypothetical protein
MSPIIFSKLNQDELAVVVACLGIKFAVCNGVSKQFKKLLSNQVVWSLLNFKPSPLLKVSDPAWFDIAKNQWDASGARLIQRISKGTAVVENRGTASAMAVADHILFSAKEGSIALEGRATGVALTSFETPFQTHHSTMRIVRIGGEIAHLSHSTTQVQISTLQANATSLLSADESGTVCLYNAQNEFRQTWRTSGAVSSLTIISNGTVLSGSDAQGTENASVQV